VRRLRPVPESPLVERRTDLLPHFRALGVIAQPWYLLVSPLTARLNDALRLLREAVAQLGVRRSPEGLGADSAANLSRYEWPRGLQEIRDDSRRFGAVLDRGNLSAAARQLDVSRQAVTKYLSRRLRMAGSAGKP
jgi:DNA-binding NtrC family response regulator